MHTIKTYFSGNTDLKHLLIILISLVVADGLVTESITRHGLGSEANPLLRAFIGSGSFLLIKFAGSILAAFVLWDISKAHPKVAVAASAIFVLIYTGIVYWNTAVFLIGHH